MAKYDYITRHNSGNYTPASRVRAVYGMDRKITAITIHHWGIKGQKFQNIVNFLCRKGGTTSAHEVIESGKVAVIVDHKNAAWHAGNGKGNATTIGLELRPEATDGDYRTAAARIADLRKEYGNLPLIPHRAWKNTACPGNWDLARLDREARAAASGNVKPATPAKPTAKPSKPNPKPKVADQSPTNTPNGSTTFPENYADLTVNGNFKSWEIGALQILLKNVIGGLNKQWDGKFQKLTIADFMTLLQRNGYYFKTPFAANGAKKGTPLNKDGGAGYWFWVEVQRMLGDDEKNRGKVYYDLKKFKVDGNPKAETYKGLQRWLNDNNN